MMRVLNETHIRNIVRETLENLILGEDDDITPNLSTEEIINLITSSQLEGKDIEVNGKSGVLDLYFLNEKYESIQLSIDFDIDAYLTPYHSGDYWTPPSGGELEVEKITPTSVFFSINDDEIVFDLKIGYNFIETLLQKYNDKIYDKINPEYFENEGPDPDDAYEWYRERKWGL